MNMHVIQTPESALELEQLCRVPLQIISPQSNCPVIGICQDSLVGAYLLTADDVKMTYGQFQQLMMTNSMFIGRMPQPDKNGFYTGKQALSTILLNFDTKYGNPTDPHVVIKDGQLIKGRLDKNQLGAKTNTLTHIIFNDYSPEDCLRFLDNEQQVVNSWLLNQNGFSVGISDCILVKKEKAEIKDIIRDRLKTAYEMLKDANANILENRYGKNPAEDFENQITTHLNKIREDTKIMSRIDTLHNRFLAMTTSGSKGQTQNLGQIMSCLGQQVVAVKQPDTPTFKQQRIPYNYGKIKGGFDGRTLPHFHRHDDSPKARGFCENSFLFGLDPYEFFFHNSSGREGLIDTAIKSVTGDTPIVIIEDGECKRVLIGDWIDEHMAKRPRDIERLPAMDQEFLRTSSETFIPASDCYGTVTWGKMSAITRHDPGREMYRITTDNGREVTVIESKSLIVWNEHEKKFVEKSTPDIEIGEYLPVTQNLPEPPVIVESISMTKYFPGTQYLYSWDFFEAKRLYEEMMQGRHQAVRGWWQANNGKKFVLPYSKIQTFARVIQRSYIDFRKDCVYPFDGNRTCGHIPANFELSRENGRFLGIYLADGDTDREAGSVRISNNSEEIMIFLRMWFDKHGIKHDEYDKPHKTINAVSHAIRGYSRMMADFINAIASRHSHNKFVPSSSFAAPIEHVKGILEGYYSTEGGIRKNFITSSSASARLTEGIAMLCSRIGIFGRRSIKSPSESNNVTTNIAPSHVLEIHGDSALKFKDQIELIKSDKNQMLSEICTTIRRTERFKIHNDIVMDAVKSIERIDVSQYQKVYDVTVPEVNNFGISNGLTLKNTADTGYLQRRLVKLMEDGKVYYDGTVRNSSRLILQFSYGSDGFDSTKLEADSICKHVYMMNDLDLYQKYKLSYGEEWNLYVDAKIRNEITKDVELEKMLNDEYEEIYGYRDLIRNEIFKNPMGKSSMNARSCDSIESQMPVNVSRLLDAAINKFRIRKRLSDLSPRYIIERVTQLMDRITGVEKESSEYLKKAARDSRLLHRIILRLHLSSKKITTHHRLTKDMFDYVIVNIEDRFRRGVVHPGDMVGVIAAQSLGQPTTQMTLNSVHYDTELLVDNNGCLERVKIGDFVENNMSELTRKSPKAIEQHPNDTSLGWLPEQSNIRILSCDKDGKITWQRIEAVTRHPVVNEDGSNDVIKVTTHSGREVIATRGKSFLMRKNNKIVPVEGKDLEIGMYLPVSKILPIEHRIDKLDLSRYLPKWEWIYSSEVQKALDYKRNANHRFWWNGNEEKKGGYGRVFDLPYKRSDTFLEAFVGRPGAAPKRAKFCKENCVYPSSTMLANAHIPESILLTEDFGFFVGAYLAEGGCTSHHLMISNIDQLFNDRIDRFCKSISLNYHIQEGPKNGGYSKTLRTHSIVITTLFCRLFGNGAANKRIPAEFLAAPDNFLKGLIDGYFSGDGTVTSNGCDMRADSISKGLLTDIVQILARYEISSRLSSQSVSSLEKVRKKYPLAQQMHHLSLSSAQTIKFAKKFRLTIQQKQNRLSISRSNRLFDDSDKIPDVITQTWGLSVLKRSQLDDALDQAETSGDRQIIQKLLDEDIIYDPIVSIDRIAHDKPFIYDLTVSGSRTFNMYSGLTGNDTFHQAGQATQFNVVDGVPRLEELISASAKPKAPQITIYLKEQFMQDEDRAEVVRNKLRQTRLSDLAKMSEIVYDPSDENTLIGQDQDFLRSYYAFMQEFNCNFDSKWVLRLELDREKMLERNIRMWEIEKALLERFGSEIQCVFADDNAKQLTVRIRVANDTGSDIPDEDQDIIFLLKQLEKSLMDSLVLRGIEGIKNAFLPARETRPFVEKIDPDGAVHDDPNDKEIVIVAEQSGVGENSLLEIFKIPEVDEYRTVSNYIGDIYSVFGIEAGRNLLFREIQRVFSSSYINHRHIEMLVDTMTCQGNLTKINRVGIHKLNVGPLARSSFEETETQFMNAAAFAEEDAFRGVSSNIMLGQYYPGGTGECEVLLDEDMLFEMKDVNLRPEPIPEETIAEQETDEMITGDVSTEPTVSFGFDFNLNE